MNVPAHASRAGTRRQPDVARLDPAHVERQRLRGALRIVSLGHLHQHDVAAGRGIERGLRPDGRHDQRVVDRRARGVGLAVAADRAGRREIQAAADDDRIGAAGGQARMRGLVVDDTGLAAQADLVAVARFHVRQRQVMRAQLADRHGPLGQRDQIAGQIGQQRLRRHADAAGQGAQPGIARGQRGLARRRAVQDVFQRVNPRVAAQAIAVRHRHAAQAQAMQAIDVQAGSGLRLQHGLTIAGRQIDQHGRPVRRQVRAQLADGLPRDQDHLPRIAQRRKRLRAQFAERDVGVLALARRRGVQDRLPRLQRDVAGGDHLAHAQVGVGLVAGAGLGRALGIGQHQVQVDAALLRHPRHAARLDIERMARAQIELQRLGAVVLVDAVGVAGAPHDVAIGDQADLALALQRARVGADDGTALGADRDGDALGGMDVAQADAAFGRVQAHRGVAIGRHHAVDRLHRQRAGQVDGEIARIAHVAHQRARLQLLRAGAVLRHEWHVDGLPDRVQEAAADVHHLQAGGPGRGDVRLQLRQLSAGRAFQHPAVVDEDLAAVLEQAEAVGEQELQFGARRQPGAELQRGIVREHGIDRPPQAGVGEVHVGAVQRDRAGGPDIAVQRVIDARQVGGIGARQDGLVGLRQRVEDVGALVAADRAQVGQLQRVFAQLRADRALPRGAQRNALPRLHIQEAIRRRHAFGLAVDIEDLFVDGGGHRIQQVVLDIAQRRRREVEEVPGPVAAAVQRDLVGRLRRRVGLLDIVAHIGLRARQVSGLEVHRDSLAHAGIQGQQGIVLARARLVEHGVGQRGRQADAAVGADDGVVRGVGPQSADRVAEVDLVAGRQRAQAALAVIHDEHVGELEAAVGQPRQRRRRAHGRGQALAPIVVVFGRLRQFLVHGVVIDHLVAHRLHQVLDARQVQAGRQVIGVVGLVLELLVQGLHLRAQARRIRHGLGLEQMRADREHAAQIGSGESRQQLRHDARVGEQRFNQGLPVRRLPELLELLVQHGLFLGREQTNAVAALDQHVVGHVVLQADGLAILGQRVVQVDPVVVLQIAVAGHVAGGIEHRHDVGLGQGDDVVRGDGRAAGRGVQ